MFVELYEFRFLIILDNIWQYNIWPALANNI